MNNNTTLLKTVIRQMAVEQDNAVTRGFVANRDNRVCAYEEYLLLKHDKSYKLTHVSFRNGREINHVTTYNLESRKNETLEFNDLMKWAKTPGARNVIVTVAARNY